jgi:hypothetical protein
MTGGFAEMTDPGWLCLPAEGLQAGWGQKKGSISAALTAICYIG